MGMLDSDRSGVREVDSKPTDSEMREYRKKEADYIRHMQQCQEARRTFPSRFAQWQQEDAARRQLLQSGLISVNQRINNNKANVAGKTSKESSLMACSMTASQ